MSSALHLPCGRITHPLDLPALGRCQSLYSVYRTSQRPVFLLNSRLTLFTVSHRGSIHKELHLSDHPFFRSYGANLPSSLTGVLSNAWECSSRLPVSDCGTVTHEVSHNDFSRQRSLNQFALAVAAAPHHPSSTNSRWQPTGLDRDIHNPDGLASCVLVMRQTLRRW